MILTVSCPSRIDIGNTVDFPNYFFSLPNGVAKTVNLAVGLRTTVTFDVSFDKHIEVIFDEIVETNINQKYLRKSKLPLVWATLNFFEIKHGRIQIHSEIPRGSGLGGSGVLLVALVTCILNYRGLNIDHDIYDRILMFCHLFENWLGFSRTGFHDQLAAIYGGANLWTWGAFFGKQNFIYQKSKLLNRSDCEYYDKRIILSFTGEAHKPTKFGSVPFVLNEYSRRLWLKLSALTEQFSIALRNKDTKRASELLNEECDLRVRIDPLRVSTKSRILIDIAKKNKVGSRYVGHGHGGCVWAIGSKNGIRKTLSEWRSILKKWPNAWAIFPNLEEKGIIVHEN